MQNNEFCLLNDAAISSVTTAGTVASGAAIGASLLSGALTSAANSNMWSMFNVLQIIELMALIDLRYPSKLNQFLHGFKFSMLNPPEKFNYASQATGEGKTRKTKNESPALARLREFGFKSLKFLVQ